MNDLLCHDVVIRHPDGSETYVGLISLDRIQERCAEIILAWEKKKQLEDKASEAHQ